MSNIFISYNRQSEAIARTLADDIEALGHTVWFDQELSGGQAWWDQILARVLDCHVFVFVLSQESLSSIACKREYGYAADLGKPILPVAVSGGVSTNLLPPALAQIQFVDYREQDRDAAFRLARALTSLPPPKPLPEPLPIPPEVPISYLGSLTEQVETTSTLSYEEQSALVVDLKRSMRDPETADDARTLLERLRKRRDLLATMAEEIGELLESTEKTPLDPLRASRLGKSPGDNSNDIIPQAEKKDGEEVKRKQPASRSKVLGLLTMLLIIGLHAGIGTLLAIGASDITYWYYPSKNSGRYILSEDALTIVLAGWVMAFGISTWLWNTARRAFKGQEKATRRFQFIFRGSVSPKVALLVLTLVVAAFNILVGIVVFEEWMRVW